MIHITRYIDKLKIMESTNSKTFTMPIQDARDLHADITKLLLVLQDTKLLQESQDRVITLELSGKNW